MWLTVVFYSHYGVLVDYVALDNEVTITETFMFL